MNKKTKTKMSIVLMTMLLVLILMGQTSCIDRQTIKEAVREATEEIVEEIYDDDEGYRDSKKWGKVTTKEIFLAAFDKIAINGDIDVIYNNADTCRVTMHGNEKVMEHYLFKSESGLLTIKPKPGLRHSPSLTVHITSPDLQQFILNGTGDLDVKSHVDFSDNILLEINGTGDIDINDMKCGRLEAKLNGTGDFKIRYAECLGNAEFSNNGTGDMKAQIEAQDIMVANCGTGDVELDVNCKNLTAKSSGTGDVELEGNTITFTRKANGLSKIDSKKLKATTIKR